MKASIQVILGLISGALLALLLPEGNIILTFMTEISTVVLSLGRYIALPLLFLSMVISVTQLQRKQLLLKSFLKLLGLSVAFSLLLVLIGIVASLIFSPSQIPVVIDGIRNIEVPSLLDLVKLSFPENFFSVFQSDLTTQANQFVPFFVLAIFLGYFFTKPSREVVEPTYNLVDSLSRIFFLVNKYFMRIAYFWVTILTAAYIVMIKNILDLEIFLSLTYMLVIITAVVVLIIYPIIFYYTCGKRNPFKYLWCEFSVIFTALLSGDLFFTSTTLIHSQKDNFKIKRESSGFNIPFLLLFSKAGTAMVSVITFIVILKSYSSLEITATQILWVGIVSFLVSFCLPTKAVGSSIASLYLLCSIYDYGGIEDSYIILSPAFPILGTVTTIINSSTIVLINVLLDPEKRLLLDKKA